MTVIVAARSKKGIILAADSQTTSGWTKMIADRSKLWTADPYVFGGAGCIRALQVIRHYTTWPKYRPEEEPSLEAFLVKSVWPAIVTGTADQGITITKEGRTSLDSTLVIAWGDHLAEVFSNGAVVVPLLGRCAAGSGNAEALGYLGDKGPWTIEQVCTAAHRATISAVGCDGQIDYVSTDDMTIHHWEPTT